MSRESESLYMSAKKDVLTLREAVALGYPSIKTLRRRVHDGSLPHERRGRTIVVKASDLDRLYRPDEHDLIKARAKAIAATAGPLTDEVRQNLLCAFGRRDLLDS